MMLLKGTICTIFGLKYIQKPLEQCYIPVLCWLLYFKYNS